MNRQEILGQITQTLGLVPDWINSMSDAELQWFWPMQQWFLSDTKLSSRDKALVALGAATATHCRY